MNNLPAFLNTYTDFRQHIEEIYEDLPSVDKGKIFATLVKDTLNSQENFLLLEANLNPKGSYDEGVDIFWSNPENKKKEIFCQSKFKIKGKDELDSVISKFKSFEESLQDKAQVKSEQLDLLAEKSTLNETEYKISKTKYIIATLWKLEGIIKAYVNSNRPSLIFYQKLINEKRLEIVDGEPFYDFFLNAYQKEYSIPQEVRFRTNGELINKENVYVGIISSSDLIEIYNTSRNGIFFENVKEIVKFIKRFVMSHQK
jgi:hypothetical protein